MRSRGRCRWIGSSDSLGDGEVGNSNRTGGECQREMTEKNETPASTDMAMRQATLREIPGARLVMVGNGGHFLPLDQPKAVIQHIRDFARQLRILPVRRD